jgi:ABC-2 type transport system ATP-binding protein
MPQNLPTYAVEAVGLHKTFAGAGGQPPKSVLIDVNLAIPRGSFFALLGPNGAGKSTFINILAGLVVKSAGDVRVWGHDIVTGMRRARRAIGVVPQELNVDPFFTPREALETQAGLYGVPKSARRTDEILAAVHLTDRADEDARRLSGGMRRRLQMAKAMVHRPPVLVLDEPTAGVDVELRRQLWDFIRGLNRDGTTILLTTHYLEEAQELCDHIAIIDHGRMIASEPTESLLRRIESKTLVITADRDLDDVPAALAGFHVELRGRRRLAFHLPPGENRVARILGAVRGAGLVIADISTEEAGLEDIFLKLTARGQRAGAA